MIDVISIRSDNSSDHQLMVVVDLLYRRLGIADGVGSLGPNHVTIVSAR